MFDPAILSATAVEEGPFLESAGPTSFFSGTIDNTAGIINGIADTLVGPVMGASGDGSLVTIAFLGKAAGISPLLVSDANLLDSTLSKIPVTVQPGAVTVEPVPEPGTGGMMALGVLMMIGIRCAFHRSALSCGSR